jgi:peptidoglycan/LPS O-acetylase OafA/YrhL
MGGLIGWLIGSLIACYLVYSLLYWAVFKRIVSHPLVRHLLAAVATYPVSATLFGFGAANGGAFRTDGFVSYLLPSVIILALAVKRGRDAQRTASEESQSAVFQ